MSKKKPYLLQPQQKKTDLSTTDLLSELCKDSFYYFVKTFWDVIIPETPVWNWHIKEICDKLQEAGLRVVERKPKHKDIIINVPPGTSKSTVCSVMFPAWLWTRDASIKIISASYSAALSIDLSTKSRDIILSDKYKSCFPEVKVKLDQAAKSNYHTTNGGARITTSTGGSATGFHAHIIIVDDPQNPELANSSKERETTNNFVSSTLSTRKINNEITLTIIVQQRLHPLDVTGYLRSKGKEYDQIILPAQLCKTVYPPQLAEKYINGLLDPIRLSREILDEKLHDMGSRAFNTQEDQNPEGDKDSIIKEAWLPIVPLAEFIELVGEAKPIVDFFLDTAYTESTKNDPSAIVATTKVGDILYILFAAEVYKELPDLLKWIVDVTNEYGYTNQSRIKVEPKASGKDVVNMLKKTDLNISESPSPATSKLERLNSIAPKCEAIKAKVVQGLWNSLFIGQVTSNYPVHDDIRDCFIMAVKEKLVNNSNSGSYGSRLGFA